MKTAAETSGIFRGSVCQGELSQLSKIDIGRDTLTGLVRSGSEDRKSVV